MLSGKVTCERLLSETHPYRRLGQVVDLRPLEREFAGLYSEKGTTGIPIHQGLRLMVLQFMEDYSDRQMERACAENIAVKWFCGFALEDETPDHSYFGKLRKRLGTSHVAKIFETVVAQMKCKGYVGEVFQFIDATAIITKTALWEERDEAIRDGLEKLNNETVGEYAADGDARFGCRGKNKYFFGYKRHVCVDMKQGVITKVAVTPGNVTDAAALKHVVPRSGMVFADKGYCDQKSERLLRARHCHSGVIKKQNMKDKNPDKDRWLTSVRMPYESVFSKHPKRARYRGWAKVQMQAFLEALAINLKRWLTLDALAVKIAHSATVDV